MSKMLHKKLQSEMLQSTQGGEECNGKRHQTGFVDIKDFDETVLKSDYHFLHNIVRESDGAKQNLRAKRKKSTRSCTRFKKKCEERGVDIRIMPAGMEKRQINTSHYDRKRTESCGISIGYSKLHLMVSYVFAASTLMRIRR